MAITSRQTTPAKTKVQNPFLRHQQPPPFTARGRGFHNRLPDFPATHANANASLVNMATGRDDLHKIYLFVDSIETGWKVAGETAQTQNARAFYPRNLTQDDLVVTGTVANQYEYDRLVQFVLHHHHSQFTNAILQATTYDGDGGYPGVVFTLFKPHNSNINVHKPLRYLVVITDVQAGAQKGQIVGIPFQLTCKVVFDYLQPQTHTENEINSKVKFQDVLGDASSPDTTTGNDNKDAVASFTRHTQSVTSTGGIVNGGSTNILVSFVNPALSASNSAQGTIKRVADQSFGAKVVAYAKTFVGYKEGPNNNTIFGTFWGLQDAWCAMFVFYCMDRFGTSYKSDFANCGVSHVYDQAQQNINGFSLTKNPVQGDLVIYDFPAEKSPFDHIGIFDKWTNKSAGKFQTVEGNTVSDAADGSQSNGDGVYIRHRSTSRQPTYFVHVKPPAPKTTVLV